MIVDFQKGECKKDISDIEFGICDDENQTPAYTTLDATKKWNAKILNPDAVSISFTAIDNCIDVFRVNGDMENRCDAMLTYPNNIVFLELKNKRADWIQEGIDQLEIAITTFKDNESALFNSTKKKRAVVANRKHPYFHTIEDKTMQQFYSRNKVRLHVGATIKI